MSLSIAIVLLSAGESSRLSEPKQHTMIGGKSLLRDRAEVLDEVKQRLKLKFEPLVVCGQWYAEDRQLLRGLDVECVDNVTWKDGQLNSLHCGLRHRATASAVLVMLVDQYRVTASDLIGLVTTWKNNPGLPAAATYAETTGVPVIWPAARIRELLLTGELPKKMLQRVPHTAIKMPHAAWDLDTPADKQTMRDWIQGKTLRK